jgi:TldD protein
LINNGGRDMTGKFSKYLKAKKPIIKKLIDILKNKYSYVSVLATDISGVNIVVDKSSTNVVPSGITESGFVVKVFNGEVYSEYSTNEIEDKNLDLIVEEIDKLVNQPKSIQNVDVKVLKEEALTKTFVRKNIGKLYSTEDIIETLRGYVEGTLATSPLIVNARASIENTEISKMFMSISKDLEQYYTWSNPRSFVLVRQENNTRYAYDGFGDNSVEKALNALKVSLENTANLAHELLTSTTPAPGYYDIITDPSITGLIAHEAFGHGVEMDMFVRDRAQAKQYMNKRVASPLVNMHDGADATFSVASYFFDDDGVLAQDTKIIDKGILINGISDALSALELGTNPTGNGRRESYKRKAYTRMTNTFFEAGNDSLDDMIKSIDYGYFISTTNNGMEDPKNWGIQCTALFGREIKDGQFTGKIVSPVVMSGYVIDLLNSITAVSKDFEVVGSGSCGKGYKEWVRVSDGGPHLKAKVKIG